MDEQKEPYHLEKMRKFKERYEEANQFDPQREDMNKPPEWFKKLFFDAFEKAIDQCNRGATKVARKLRKKNKKGKKKK